MTLSQGSAAMSLQCMW